MLPEMRIASPCSADWNKMIGDDRVRFCPQCKLNVYNFSAMPEREIAQLVARRDGRLCARWYRRADGTMLTSDCPVGFRARVKRVSKVAGAALMALLGVSPLAAQTQPVQPTLVQLEGTKQENGAILVRVEDQTGALVPNTTVTLLDEKKTLLSRGKTSEIGELRFTGLAPGHYRIQAEFPGFAIADAEAVAKKENGRTAQEPFVIVLRVGIMGEVVTVSKPNVVHRIFSKLR